MTAFNTPAIESIERMKADAAAIAVRRTTPQEVLERRRQQRLSISELNALDIDAVRERFSRLDASDQRPGIVKFLDLIDMPRNLIANGLARTVLPGAARRADERGEEATAGITRITGADLLRGLGLNNRVVAGVGGFAVDVLTDPLIWLGGPIKTGVVKGARGAVELGATGTKALRTGLKEVGRGGIEAVSNPTTRRLFETAGKARGIDVAAGGKDAAAALSKSIIGDPKSVLTRVGDAFGLPTTRTGGDLAELTFKTADNAGIARTPEFAEYIRAVGDFVDQNTLNRGLRLGSPAASGTAIAHVPFTDITVYTPAWTKHGRQAVAQRAIARAQSGDPFTAGVMATQLQHMRTVDTLVNDAVRAADEHYRNSATIASTFDDTERAVYRARNQQIEREFTGIPAEPDLGVEEVKGFTQKIADTMKEIREERFAAARSAEGFDELGDLLAAAELTQEVDAKAQQALALARMHATRADVASIRGLRESAEERAARLVYGMGKPDPVTVIDDLAPQSARVGEYEKIVRATLERQNGRLADIIDLADEDLGVAEQLADVIGQYVTASHEVAAISRSPLRSTLTGDMRDLVTAASRALGTDRDQIGGIPFAPVGSALRRMGGVDSASVADVMSRSIARTFGGIGGDADAMRAYLTAMMRVGAHDEGAQVAREFIKGGGRFGRGIEAIAQEAGVPFERMDDLIEVVYAMAARRAESSPEYWATRLVLPGEDRPITKAIERATRSGVLKDASPKVMQELNDLATAVGGYVDELGDLALAERELNLLLMKGDYLPLSLTDEARGLLRSQQREGLLQTGRSAGSGGARARQAFQQPRGTWEIRYRDPESGELRTFLEMDRTLYGSLEDVDLLAIANSPDPRVRESLKEIERIRADIERFDELFPASAGENAINRTRVHGRPLSAIELNEMFDGGAFQAITGGVFQGKRLFETNLPKLIAGRTAASRINESRRAFVSSVEPFAVPIQSRIATDTLRPGAEVVTRTGQKLSVVGNNRFRLGDTIYRPLVKEKFEGLPISPFDHLEKDADNLFHAVYPEQLAETIERFAEQLTPDRVEGVLKAANDVHRLWRATTLAHPSWSVVNAIGNALMMSMATGRPDQAAVQVKNAVRAIAARRNPEKLASMTFRFGEQEVTGTELMQLAERLRVTNGGAAAEMTEHLIGKIADNAAPLSRTVRDFPARLKGRYERALAEGALARKTLGVDNRAGRAVDQMKAGAVAFRDEVSTPAVRTWFRINGGIDDAFRLGLFMHYMDEGSDAASAAAKVRKALFNFGDFTSAEATVLRPILPFYSWLRASGPNMLEKLFREPRYFSSIPKLQEAVEELAAGENTVPRHMRPRWLQQQLAIQIGTDPELRSALTIGTIIPQEQALRVATGALGAPGAIAEAFGFDAPFDGADFMDAADFLLGSTGPAFKTFIDLGTGRESFTGREIGPNTTEGDISLTEYLLGQIRPFREFGVGSAREGPLQRSFGEGIGTGVARLAIGGRLQPHLREERRASSVLREMRDKERRIRRSIAVAEREGNERASIGSRAALLRLYADYIENGGDAGDVPRWARDQLAQIQEQPR